MLPLKMSRCLANAVHPAVILLWISLSWFLSPVPCSFQRSRSECCWQILMCRFPSSPLSSICSSSDPDFHFHQLIPVAFVVDHVVYYRIRVSRRRSEDDYDIRRLSSSLWFQKSLVGICIRVLPWTARATWYLPVVLLSWCWACCFLCVGGLSSSCLCIFPSGVRCTHLLSPVLEARSVLPEFALSRMFSRSRRMRSRMEYYIIICISPSVRLRYVKYPLLNPACSRGLRRLCSLAFSLVRLLSSNPHHYRDLH